MPLQRTRRSWEGVKGQAHPDGEATRTRARDMARHAKASEGPPETAGGSAMGFLFFNITFSVPKKDEFFFSFFLLFDSDNRTDRLQLRNQTFSADACGGKQQLEQLLRL